MKHFGRFLSLVLFVSMVLTLLPGGMIKAHAAGDYTGYTSLDDGADKITFDGETVTWNGQTWTLGTNTIFLDYRLEDAYVAENPYAFNDVLDAIQYLNAHQGSKDNRMNFLIAPGVYWLDDPDDPAIREGAGIFGGTVTGGYVKISCNYLTFQGLHSNPSNVVICANRGQQAGAQGNFTNINMKSTDLITRNLTFGNYCNVDLVFPLDSKLPEGQKLSRAKRSEVITQAQLFNMGVKATMYNTNFISRLNLCPLTGTYYNCRLESSGHSGAGSNFINCDLYFYNMNFAGGKYFNCDITICPFDSTWYGKTEHAFNWQDTYTVGGMALIDCRIHSAENLKKAGVKVELTWGKPVDGKYPYSYTSDGYTYNVTLDGEPYLVQEAYTPGVTVDLAKYPTLLAAYRVVDPVDGTVYYNLANNNMTPVPEQLAGNAAAIQAIAEAEGKASNYYTNIPTTASLSVSASTILSGETTATITPKASGSKTNGLGDWNVFFRDADEAAKYAELQNNGDGTWTLVGKNDSEEDFVAIVVAQNELGIMKAAEVTIQPSKTTAPVIVGDVTIGEPVDGRIPLNYTIDLGSDKRTEQSIINWYLCDDAAGTNPVLVALSRDDIPEYEYIIGEGDVGKYVMATIQPKHNRSDAGKEIKAISTYAIKAEDIKVHYIDNDMRNMPDGAQTEYKPGAWVRDGYKPVDCKKQATWVPSDNSWTYGPGKEGAMGYNGFIYTKQGGRLYYNPVEQKAGNMYGEVTLATAKNAGQGFGSANDQYTEMYIKYNQQLAMNPTAADIGKVVGYGVRCQRLNATDIDALEVPEGAQPWKNAGAGSGTAFSIVRLVIQDVDGTLRVVPEHITYRYMTSAYNSLATMSLEYKDGQLIGHIESTMVERSADAHDYLREVTLTVDNIPDNGFSGFGYQSTGTTNWTLSTNTNYTMVNSVKVLWGNPAIEADVEAAEFGDVAVNEEAKQVVKISAEELADVLDIEVEGDGIDVVLGDDFDNTNGGEITILVDTSAAGEIVGAVTIKTEGAELVIPVNANVKAAPAPTGDSSAIGTMVAVMVACAAMIVLVSKKRVKA